jgi:hypothetical protein
LGYIELTNLLLASRLANETQRYAELFKTSGTLDAENARLIAGCTSSWERPRWSVSESKRVGGGAVGAPVADRAEIRAELAHPIGVVGAEQLGPVLRARAGIRQEPGDVHPKRAALFSQNPIRPSTRGSGFRLLESQECPHDQSLCHIIREHHPVFRTPDRPDKLTHRDDAVTRHEDHRPQHEQRMRPRAQPRRYRHAADHKQVGEHGNLQSPKMRREQDAQS